MAASYLNTFLKKVIFEKVIIENCIRLINFFLDHLTEEEAAIFITQILEGVENFHAKNIVHLDLKVSLIVKNFLYVI